MSVAGWELKIFVHGTFFIFPKYESDTLFSYPSCGDIF